MSDRNKISFEFQGLGQRKVEADLSGGHFGSDSGVLLFCELDQRLGLSGVFFCTLFQ